MVTEGAEEGAEEGAVQSLVPSCLAFLSEREAGQEVWGLHMASVRRTKYPQGQGHCYLGEKMPKMGFFSA